MSRTFRNYTQTSSNVYGENEQRKNNRSVRRTLRSTRINDLTSFDGDKFLDFDSEERFAPVNRNFYED